MFSQNMFVFLKNFYTKSFENRKSNKFFISYSAKMILESEPNQGVFRILFHFSTFIPENTLFSYGYGPKKCFIKFEKLL